jgi:hypothetical protein
MAARTTGENAARRSPSSTRVNGGTPIDGGTGTPRDGGQTADSGTPAAFGAARLLIVGVIASVVYSVLSTSSLGVCLGGGSDIRSECVQIELSPQPYVYALMAVIAVATILFVRSRGLQGKISRRVVTLGLLGMVIVAVLFSMLHSLAFLRANVDVKQGVDIVLPFFSNATVTAATP